MTIVSTVERANSFDATPTRTLTLERPDGPFVVDVWEPRDPTDVPPILLVHGWGNSGGYWRGTAQALSQTARVIVPDLPGTGRSQPVATAQNMFDQVDTLASLLRDLDLAQVQVVGHSMGGAMSILLADAEPARVTRLVLTSTCFFVSSHQERIYNAIMDVTGVAMRFRPPWLAELPGVPRAMASRYFYRVPSDDLLLREGLVDYLSLHLPTAIACANNATDPAIPAAGRRLQMPTLLVACREDRVMPVENVDYSASIIPDCRVQWIEECGHLPMVEKPGEYLAILEEFLDL